MDQETILEVPVDDLAPFVNQSREAFDEEELHRLSDDIKDNGLLQPGVAWFDAGRGAYTLICGERRWRALKLAGRPTMAVKVITGDLTQGQMLTINLSENLQRENLTVIERAKAFRRLAQLEGITAGEVAGRMHVSPATVSRDLKILTLPEELLPHVASGKIPASVAYELSRIDDEAARREMAEAVVAGRLGRDAVAERVQARVGKKQSQSRPKASRLACRLEGGINVTVSSGEALTFESLLAALDRLRRAAKRLSDNGEDVSALSRALNPS